MSVSKHAKVALGTLVSSGDDFLATHPLFGAEGDMPKTAAKLRELATQVGNGLITAEEADLVARATADQEFDSLDAKVQERVTQKMDDGFMQQLVSGMMDTAA